MVEQHSELVGAQETSIGRIFEAHVSQPLLTAAAATPMDSSVAPPKKQIQKTRPVAPIVECPICKKGNAQHKLYGIVACKACAKCFSRFFSSLDTLVCDDNGREQCDITDHDKHKMCNKCRVLKCLSLGMKLKKGAK